MSWEIYNKYLVTMSTHLDNYFTSISTEADLEAFIRDGQEENLHLEFKQKVDSRTDN